MKKIWKNNKLIIVISIYCLALLLVIFFLAVPFSKKIKEKADNIQKKIIDNQIDKERIGKIPQMDEANELIESKKEELDFMMGTDDEVEFIEKLESLAEETGNKMTIKIDDPTVSDSKAKKTSNSKKNEKKTIKESLLYDNYVSMEINLTGEYSGLVNFIRKLENFKYYVNVISIESKKEVEISENKVSPEIPKSTSLFSGAGMRSSVQPKSEEIRKKEKDVLASVINIIVYKK